MLNLLDQEVSYLLVSPCRPELNNDENILEISKVQSILYSRDYSLISLTGYCGGTWDKSFIAYNQNNNNTLREDAIFMLENTPQENIVIKYKGDEHLKLINHDGSETLLSVQNYSENKTDSKIFIYNGYYFSLKPEKRWRMIEAKSELKKGMKLEYFNNEKWNEKIIHNLDEEYERMYKLLIKYKKLRMEVV